MREAVLIAKLTSRNGPEAFSEVSKALTDNGISIVEAHQVENKKELLKRVKRAVKSGHKLILVAGGDGSQTAAVGPLAYTDAVLGVIPAGTGNSFCQTLGIKPTIADAIHTILNGRVAEVDLGIVNGEYFANFATIGLSAVIGADTPKIVKKIAGGVAYGLAAIGPLLTHPPFSAKVAWEKNELKVETFQMIVANGRFFGNTPVLPDANITDGKLSFFTTQGSGRLEILRMYLAFVRGTQTSLPDAHYFQTKKLTVKTKKPQPIAIDGSTFGKTPATFSVAKKALRVMVPQEETAEIAI
ncbi:MAG: YegS/Rv2252/BmrU family lipid kinase [Candidatus Eremiobacteraeota bacterium]|nr:YegS/Rv2252/BmrU family lipid kinase [Candidatus Eremiobacteraeota bacterium]